MSILDTRIIVDKSGRAKDFQPEPVPGYRFRGVVDLDGVKGALCSHNDTGEFIMAREGHITRLDYYSTLAALKGTNAAIMDDGAVRNVYLRSVDVDALRRIGGSVSHGARILRQILLPMSEDSVEVRVDDEDIPSGAKSRVPLAVITDGNPSTHVESVPDGFRAMGVVCYGDIEGALLQDQESRDFFVVNGDTFVSLPHNRVLSAITGSNATFLEGGKRYNISISDRDAAFFRSLAPNSRGGNLSKGIRDGIARFLAAHTA